MDHVVRGRGPHLGQSIHHILLLQIEDDDSDVRVAYQKVETLIQLRLGLEDQRSIHGSPISKVVIGGLKMTTSTRLDRHWFVNVQVT